MVRGNPPMQLSHTGRTWECLEAWNAEYQDRANRWGDFLACRALFLELCDPPVLSGQYWRVFKTRGRVPCTQNPPTISPAEYGVLRRVAGIAVA